jgi:hypothetical protein
MGKVSNSMSDTNKGEWAVAVRVVETGKGCFIEGAQQVDETTARKSFGRAIRAGELGLPVDGQMINGVRLLRWDHAVVDVGGGDAIVDADGDWKVVQEHSVGSMKWWKDKSQTSMGTAPYHEETVPLGVPCIPGAWGGDGCAMHSGFPLDANGLCAEGHRAVRKLALIVVPKAMQERSGFPSTMTREEVDLVYAETVQELVHREKDHRLTDEQLNQALVILEARKARADRGVVPAPFDENVVASPK